MKRQDFLDAVRRGGEKLRVDNVFVTTQENELCGKGVIQIADGSFQLFFTLSEPAVEPPSPTGIVTKNDFWIIRGLIEDEIEFQLHALPDRSSKSVSFGRGERSSLEFSSNRIELIPSGFDRLTTQQKWEMQERGRLGAGLASGEDLAYKPVAPTGPAEIVFHAVLPDFKLVDHNGGTVTTTTNAFLGDSSRSTSDTFHGGLLGWDFGLIERDGDLHVHLISKPELQSTGPQHDWRLFTAFLNALAFVRGQHAWPFSVQHFRDGKLILDRIQLNGEVAYTPHMPFTNALAFGNAVGGPAWSFRDALEKSYIFFSGESKLPRESENLLYILREASARGVPRRITLLSLCSLLESLVRVIYEERIEAQMAVETGDFQKAKQAVLKELRERNQPTLQRLIAILSNAEPVNNRLRFGAVIKHLELMPQDTWLGLYDLWSKFRNPISHRMSESDDSTKSVNADLLAESRIAGAINCMILKLMNYSGPVRLSTYEDKYTRI